MSMKRRWAFPVPLHLSQEDHSADAAELRLHLYQYAFAAVKGQGFRLPRGTNSKRKHPRMGHGPLFSRPAALFLNAKYGERVAQ